MTGRNWSRPVHRVKGKITESIDGSDVPLAPAFGMAPRPDKQRQRDHTARLIDDFLRRGGIITRPGRGEPQ